MDINYTYKGQTRNYNTRDAINAKNLAIKYYEDYYTKEEALQLITEGMFRKIKGIKVLKEYTLFYKRLRFLYSKEVVLSASKSNRRVTDYNYLTTWGYLLILGSIAF